MPLKGHRVGDWSVVEGRISMAINFENIVKWPMTTFMLFAKIANFMYHLNFHVPLAGPQFPAGQGSLINTCVHVLRCWKIQIRWNEFGKIGSGARTERRLLIFCRKLNRWWITTATPKRQPNCNWYNVQCSKLVALVLSSENNWIISFRMISFLCYISTLI